MAARLNENYGLTKFILSASSIRCAVTTFVHYDIFKFMTEEAQNGDVIISLGKVQERIAEAAGTEHGEKYCEARKKYCKL